MIPHFDSGAAVRVVRTVRNDGTYPGMETGQVLARAGSLGHVRNVGTFLQDQIIYAVHFTSVDRIVGCRQEELIGADEAWVETRFLARDHVAARIPLAVAGQVVVTAGQMGEVVHVVRNDPTGPAYHVHFGERVFRVPESALIEEPSDSEDA